MIPISKVPKFIDIIHKSILLRDKDTSLNIFLCGANPTNKKSIRNLIYEKIKHIPRFNVVFPEWLFSNVLANKEKNLLDLETILAKNVDVIILPIEGYGTIAELGAFASFENLAEKIIVINNVKFKLERGFINIGPINLIKSKNKRNIIYYGDDDESKVEMIENVVNKLRYSTQKLISKDVNNIFQLSRFLFYVIAFFQPISKSDIQDYITFWKNDIEKFLIDPCLELLRLKKYAQVDFPDDEEVYTLNMLGHKYLFDEILPFMGLRSLASKLRTDILLLKNRKLNKLDLNKERERLLVAS